MRWFIALIIASLVSVSLVVCLMLINTTHVNGFSYSSIILNSSNCINPSLILNLSNVVFINVTSMYLGSDIKPLVTKVNQLSLVVMPVKTSMYCGALKRIVSSVAYYNVTISLGGSEGNLVVNPGFQYTIRIRNLKITIPVVTCNGKYYVKIEK